jgi:tripartite-type tricarboxylate transporter receptor subunit TctC
MINVPFKGGAPAATALIGGQVDLMFEQTYAALPSIQSGRTRPLAVTSDKRIAALPQVPTFAELGYPKVEVFNWMGIIAPKATPPAIITKLNAAFAKALVHPELRAKMLSQNNAPGGGPPEEFGALIASELEKWTGVVRTAGIKIE